MNGRGFDNIARLLASGVTRRRAVKLIAAGIVGAVHQRAGLAATCRDVGRTCREDVNCCSRRCNRGTVR